MLHFLKRLVCRHTWFWSERRRLEVCYGCGKSRHAPEGGQPLIQSAGLPALPHPPQHADAEDELFKFPWVLDPGDEGHGRMHPGPGTEWAFGTLQDQFLSQARVVSRRRKD